MKKIFIAVGIVIVLALGYYLISPLFRNIKVDDALPPTATSPQNEQSSGAVDVLGEGAPQSSEEISAEELSMPKPEQTADKSFPVMGTPGHPAEGSVRLIETSEGMVIRYENYTTINGPDLRIYLSKDIDAKDFVDLGKIRGTSGNINYTVPENIDTSEYRYVLTWCKPFRVLFNYAELR